MSEADPEMSVRQRRGEWFHRVDRAEEWHAPVVCYAASVAWTDRLARAGIGQPL